MEGVGSPRPTSTILRSPQGSTRSDSSASRHDDWTPYARPSEHGATAHTRLGLPSRSLQAQCRGFETRLPLQFSFHAWSAHQRTYVFAPAPPDVAGVAGLLNSNNLTVQLAPWFLAAALRASSQSLRNCTIPLSVSGW